MTEVPPVVRIGTFYLPDWPDENLLSPEEAQRAHAIADLARRTAYRRTRSLVRRALARQLNVAPEAVVIEISPTGKPAVAGRSAPAFSLSHSGDWLALAITDRPVGIDIETHTPRLDPLTLARRFFSATDSATLSAASDPAEMFRLQWVAKEAAAKVDGAGLAGTLDRMECRFRAGQIIAVRRDLREFSIASFRLPNGSPGAVAVEGGREIRLINDASALLS